MPLDAFKNSLGIGQLRQLHDVPDDPARQLHLRVLVLRIVCKPAHRLRLDVIMQVHQHVQPFGAFHAQCPRHTGLLRRCLPQRPCAVAHTARRPGVIDDAFILFRRVSVPHAVGLPQRHAVASCLCHCLAPAAVPLHKLVLRLSGLVHGVFQLVQLRVLVPQLRIAVGRPVLDLARQRFGQRFGLVHVRAVGLQVVHQHFGLLRQLRPVGLAAVGLQPAPGQLVHRAAAHVHAPCQPKELAQRVQRRRLLRDHPACLLLLVPLRVPARLLRDLETHIRHTVQHRGTLGIVSGLVQLHLHALLLQLVDQALACVVRQNRRPHFVKAHGTLRLCLKVPGRDLRHVLVQFQDLLRRVLADDVPFLRKHFSNGRRCPLALRRLHQDAAQNFLFFKAARRVCCRLAADALHHFRDLAVRFFQQLVVFFLRHLLQSALVCPHLVQRPVLCCGRAHQGLGRKSPRALSSRLLLLVHGLHKVFQRVGIVQLSKAAPVAGSRVGVFPVVNSLFTQHLFHLRQ